MYGHFFFSKMQDEVPPTWLTTCRINGKVMEYSQMQSGPRWHGILYRLGLKKVNKLPDTQYLGYGTIEYVDYSFDDEGGYTCTH